MFRRVPASRAALALASAALAALVSTAAPHAAHAQATLLNGLGGPAGYGPHPVPPNDDGSYCGDTCTSGFPAVPVDLTAAFPGGLNFFGHNWTQAYVNNNGNITFMSGLSTFTPHAFPGASQPIIAPWWGDVDTRGDSIATGNLAWWSLQPGQFVATWHNVGYYGEHYDKRNDFQLIITTASGCGVGDFDVEFRYHQCQWTTGDASGGSGGFGGSPAVAGFDSGDGVDYVTLPGSATMTVLNLCTTSNVGMPGVWRFRIRGGALPCAGSGDPCVDTSNPMLVGACRNGTMQCRGMTSVCVASVHPSMEVCDGQDNDCNGMTDEGDGLCPSGQVCSHGTCVGRCVEGSCFEGQTCTSDGTCVETACMGVTCPMDQVCHGGTCMSACGGVYCPPPNVCQLGRCVDPCASMHCDTGDVCEDGRCQPACQCRACPSGQVCQMDGHCVDRGCDTMTCPDGQTCRGGACVDACSPPTPDMVPCGHFEHCEAGHCVSGAAMPDAGMTTTDAGGGDDASTGNDASGNDASADGGDGSHDGGGTIIRRESGCSCRTAGAPAGGARGPAALLALAGAAALVVTRRRNRR